MVRNLHRPTGQNKPQKIRCWPKKSRILISNDLCTVLSSSLIPPPPSTSWFSPSAGFVKCRCLYVSVRVRAEASWLEYVTFWKKVCQMMYFWLFFFFFFYSTDIIHKTNPIRRWHIYQFPTSAHKRPADSYVPCCLAWLILTTTTSPAWGLTDRVKWCHRPFILKIRSLWLSTGLCCSLCRLFFFFYGFCSDDPHM